MDKSSLNNEIILCRGIVKKACVRIIRKKISKVKILRCAVNKDKEKKQKKADRIVEEILMLKKIKPDEVTKFALTHLDLEEIVKNTPANHKDHALATLAMFPELQNRAKQIRLDVADWEVKLPKLLQELGTRSMLKKWKRINKGLPEKPSPKFIKDSKQPKNIQEVTKTVDSEKTPKKSGKKTQAKAEESAVVKKPEPKVDDPFFVSKKVTLPKLLLSEAKENPGKEIKFNKEEPERRQFIKVKPNLMPRLAAKEEEKVEEKLHPSWAAKKVKMIQPFQGKKIKFDD